MHQSADRNVRRDGRNFTVHRGGATIGAAAASGIGDGPEGEKYDQAVRSMVEDEGSVQVTLPDSAIEKLRQLRSKSGSRLTVDIKPQGDGCKAVIVIDGISQLDAAILIRKLHS